MKRTPSSLRMLTSASPPVERLSLMRLPRFDAAAAMAATRFGSVPLDNEGATGKPSFEDNKTPRNSGIALRRDSICVFSASCFAIILLTGHNLGRARAGASAESAPPRTGGGDCGFGPLRLLALSL